MPTIPNGLKPVVDGYSIGAPGGVTRIPVGGGVPRYGLEWDYGQQPFQVRIPVTSLQLSVWMAFFHHVIKNGSLPFDMPLDSGAGQATHEVTIVPGSYAASRVEGDVSAVTMVVLARPTSMTQEEALALIAAFEAAHGPLLRVLRPVVSGYSIDGPDGVNQSEVRGGLTLTAQEWGRGCQVYGVTMVLTAEQFSVWTAFFFHVAKKGAATFGMYLDSGFGEEEHSVNVVPGSYSAVRNGAITVVTFAVEAESTVYGISSADASSLIDLYNTLGPEMSALLRRIDQFANHDTLVLP